VVVIAPLLSEGITMKKKTLAILAAAAAGATLAMSAAHAGVVSYSATYGPEQTDWDPAKVLSLSKFNPTLGTLNSVSFEFTGSLQAAFDAESTSNKLQTITNALNGSMRFTLPTAAEYQLVLAQSESVALPGFASYANTIDDTDSASDTLWSDLSAFIGSGSFDVGVLAFAEWTQTGGGNLSGGADTFAAANVSVSYDYTDARQAVPEPASLALVGLALSAAALSRRRRA
jgi:hypothetical protein